MKYKLFITLILVIISGTIVSFGCGGGNNEITTPASVMTPVYDIDGNVQTGCLILSIMWPQLEESIQNDLISSMPYKTNSIDIKIYERDNTSNLLAERLNIKREPPDATDITVEIDSLPLVWIKVIVIPYDSNGIEITEAIREKEFKLTNITTFNIININLGTEGLSVWPKDDNIPIVPQIASSAIVQPTPVPELGGETEIIAQLVLESPDITPQPTMTPFGGSEVSGSNLEAQGEVGLENYEVRLTIVEGIGELIPAAGGTLEGDSVVTYTDNYGYCNAILKTNRPGIIKIKAECDLLATATTLSTSGDRILTAYCTVTALVPGGGEDALLYDLYLRKPINYGSIRVIPDFRSPDGLRLDLFNWISGGLEVLDLTTVDPGDPRPEWQPAPYKTVNFEIIEGWGADVNPATVVTDANGALETIISITDDIETERTIIVQGSFDWGSTPGDPNHMAVTTIDFPVETDPDVGDNFESYPPNTKAYDLRFYRNETLKWEPQYWQANNDAMNNDNNCISSGANGTAQSIQLYTPPSAPYGAYITTKIAQWGVSPDLPTGPFELRFYVKMGNETLNDSEAKRGAVSISGVNGDDTIGGMNFIDLITFKDNGNLILDCKGNTIGSYTDHTWLPVRIQFVDDLPGLSLGSVKINYWIDNNFITSPTIVENLYYYDASHFLMLWSCGGTVWYDEVKIYDFNECIINYY